MVLRFKYTPQIADDGSVFYTPLVGVTFIRPNSTEKIAVYATIDSGASSTLIHRDIGEQLGIKIETGTLVRYQGIGGIVEAYKHSVVVQVHGDNRVFEIVCAFARLEGTGVLFGTEGFFEHYKVVFEKYNNTFSLIRHEGKK